MVKITKIISKSESEKYSHVSKLLEFDVLAWQSGFYKKNPKKITVTNLIGSFWEMQQLGKNSLRNWSLQMGLNTNETITKQSLNERLNENTLTMTKAILRKSLNESNGSDKKREKWLDRKKKNSNLFSIFLIILFCMIAPLNNCLLI